MKRTDRTDIQSGDDGCGDDRLRSLLRDEEDSYEYRSAVAHVDACATCQIRLEELAADEDVWNEAHGVLANEVADEENFEEAANAEKHPWARSRWQRRPTAWTESMAQQLLSPAAHPEMLGRIGRYDVDRLIGSGGMGLVFKAFDTELNRPVAVKVLAPYLAGSGAARKRFAREARAAAAIVHEHVVAIHNVETDGEAPFLVMPFVAGESLQQRLDREGPLELCEILRIALQTASGLAAAHAQGLVHRDVKPANILLEQGVERALLTDFGLARAGDDASLTHTGYHPGTPQYMSPEQARGESMDARSDLFSLGSMIYAMCTGRAPFRAETSYGVLRRITDEEPRPIRELNQDIPAWLCQINAKLMSKQLDGRFQSAREVAELLRECLAHVQQPTAVPLPRSVKQLPRLPSAAKDWRPKKLQLFSKPSFPKGVVTMFAALTIGLLGTFLWQSTTPPDISGNWTGEQWGQVELKESAPGKYEGISGDKGRTMELKWSRTARRFNGTWKQGDDQQGRISIRRVGDEIRGAWSTEDSLADLFWKRKSDKADEPVARLSNSHKKEVAAKTTNSEGLALDEADAEDNVAEIVKGTLARYDAVQSGIISYSYSGRREVKPAKYRLAFAGPDTWRRDNEEWVQVRGSREDPDAIQPPRKVSTTTVNQDGRLLHFAGSGLEVHYPASLSSNRPTRAGTVWYQSTRDFISDHADKVRMAGSREVNGVATKILEWDVPANDRRPFHAVPYSLALDKGGKLRLFVSPQLGYVVARVEFSDRLDILHGRLDFSGFREVADGLHLPYSTEIALGSVDRYQINLAEKINKEIPETEFALAIPTQTSVQDRRPKQGTPKAGGYPYKRFKTSIAYPDGFPPELLEELDRDVAPAPLTNEQKEALRKDNKAEK